MKMEVGHAITKIVEAMLPIGTQGKVLHISMDVDYMVFPKKNDDSESLETIERRLSVHYVFRRSSNYTMVLRCVNNSFYIEDGDVFEMTSYHDSCWRSDGVESDIRKISQKVMKEIEAKYAEIAGREMPYLEIYHQPNLWFKDVKLIEATTDSPNHDHRNYRLEIKDGKIHFSNIR